MRGLVEREQQIYELWNEVGREEEEGEGRRGKIGVSVLLSTHVLRYDQQYGRGLPFLSL